MSVNRGDLILYPVVESSDWIDQEIGKAQSELGQNVGQVQFEHCAISAGNEMVYEAKWPRTDLYRIDRTRPFFIFHINGVTEQQIEMGMIWLEAHRHELYNLLALFTAGWINSVHEQVCSTYMAGYIRATQKATSFLTGFVTPDQILQMVSTTRVLEA